MAVDHLHELASRFANPAQMYFQLLDIGLERGMGQAHLHQLFHLVAGVEAFVNEGPELEDDRNGAGDIRGERKLGRIEVGAGGVDAIAQVLDHLLGGRLQPCKHALCFAQGCRHCRDRGSQVVVGICV
jgi:hypothetical protein